jgi:hypothetical protein
MLGSGYVRLINSFATELGGGTILSAEDAAAIPSIQVSTTGFDAADFDSSKLNLGI